MRQSSLVLMGFVSPFKRGRQERKILDERNRVGGEVMFFWVEEVFLGEDVVFFGGEEAFIFNQIQKGWNSIKLFRYEYPLSFAPSQSCME